MPRRATLLAVVPALACFILHAAPLRGWIVDDAGISFAYSRSFAAGHGLVSQPGRPPVEGFSNPLWTLLLAVFFRLHLFDVVWTPKILSLALVAATFALVAGDLRRDRPQTLWPAVLATMLIASSTSFVVWTTSGLENPLLAVLAALSCVVAARAATGERRLDAPSGAIAALLALTRPDAAVYAAALPLALLLSREAWRTGIRDLARRLAMHAGGFVPLFGGYLLFRRAYFGTWAPNTYYAKDKPSLAFLLDSYKWTEILTATLGTLGLWAGALLLGAALFLLYRGGFCPRRRSLAIHLALAVAAYMLMPLDWMGEYRFATPFFLFFYWALAETVAGLWTEGARVTRVAAVALGLAFVGASALTHLPRTTDFCSWRIVPFETVAEFDGHGFNRLADDLPGGATSLLTPDVGGALFYSRLTVYDLVGLTDRTAARTLTTDTPAFHRYVFETLRPTFIHVHGPWAGWASFHQSARFKDEYVPIREIWPAPESTAAKENPGEPVWGDYVRRDALGPNADAVLARLRSTYKAAHMERDNI